MNFVAAAWVVVQGTEAVASFTSYFFESYYFRYAGATSMGNNVGIYELVSYILWAVFSLSITGASLYLSYTIWGAVDARVAAAEAAGGLGIIMDPVTAVKLFVLLNLNGFMSIIGGFGLGDVSRNLLTWWDSYGQTQKAWFEGRDVNTNKLDADGTAIEFDFIYHWVVLGVSYLLFSVIAGGGFLFLYNYMSFGAPAKGCNLKDPMSSADTTKMLSLFQQSLTSLDDCYTYFPQLLATMDTNKNGFIDKCEDAWL